MRFGLDVSQHQLEWSEILHRSLLAEELEFDGAWVFDHFKPLYGDPDGPCLEAYTLLAAIAASTTRLRIGAMVTGMTYRHPSILAAEAVTVDHISGGRLELAVGAAWFKGEHDALGIEFPSVKVRAERLEEGIELMRKFMTDDHSTFDGNHFHLRDATFHPHPVQKPHPPIWVGASGEKLMMPIVARQANVWHHSGAVEEMARKNRLLDEMAKEAGRTPADITRAGSVGISEPWEAVRTRTRDLQALGFSYIHVGWPSEGHERVREFAHEVMPEFV
ncbi:MAG TPA: LLM class flavin-dependent oxidoreductase [Chloroflexota bacterium]|jgi:alkanesulfonate monooxygenase SsuD/methylene tetrahydromethanopterin reductase-like flavin-dependent oxidoreductase (luciferase family)|nr:LLM class flavin-dependent oxidoreductase [Chloroflexota bacterium]